MDLTALFQNHLQNSLIEIETFHPHYERALNYMLQARGKGFRPLLLLSVVEGIDPLLIDSALDPALAVELFHTYSLIHDDLPAMDDADLRRGVKSLHREFDEVTAILVGDALNTHAFYIIASSPLSADTRIALTRELSLAGGVYGMVHGQILDCYFERRPLDLERLSQLHINKTAKLIAASLKMGGIIVNLPQEELDELYNFGIDLGLLFQIQDDLIDTLSSAEEAGKTTQNDTEKNSFTQLLGVDGALREADLLAQELQRRLERFRPSLIPPLERLLGSYLFRHQRLKGDDGRENTEKDG
ncbi:MAG: polyprenyl synthetase family protein [Epsilonproteobacteria bacterium]|nr:geranyl transferase [Campylobacterota bacterium]NPA57525.1 polyprenyl synthetase family protein [Campylobacterota bacterium]